jgi:hypothetical protein
MKKLLWLAASAALAVSARADWFREIQISSEPEVDGQKDFTVRFTPLQTRAFARFDFECVYRQVFRWKDVDGTTTNRILEPVTFTYQRPDVKTVNDLDLYISFRVPVSLKRLVEIYGPKTFNTTCPVTVDRIRISGHGDDAVLWTYELKADNKHDAAAILSSRPRPATNEVDTAGDLDLDVIKQGFK